MKSALSFLFCLVLITGCRTAQQERFLADVRINGKPACFAYDTGAGVTLVQNRSAKRLGLKVCPPPPSGAPDGGGGHT